MQPCSDARSKIMSSSTTGNGSVSNLVGTGSNKLVVGLDAVISLFSSTCPIIVKHCNIDLGGND